MPKVLEGKISGEGLRFAIVVSRFNDFISSKLVEGALDALIRHGADDGGKIGRASCRERVCHRV